MLGPVARELHLEQLAQLFLAVGFEDVTHQPEPSRYILCEHRDASIGEILWPDAEQFPRLRFHGMEREFVGKKGIFRAQLVVISIGTGARCAEHAGLAKEQSLYLQQRVAVLVQQPQRRAAGQSLEGIVVDAEA